jgi:hypothetical protein
LTCGLAVASGAGFVLVDFCSVFCDLLSQLIMKIMDMDINTKKDVRKIGCTKLIFILLPLNK